MSEGRIGHSVEPPLPIGGEVSEGIDRRGLGIARAIGWAGSVTLCVLLPVVMVVSNKSAPVALALGALLTNAAVVAAGRTPDLLARYRRLLRTGSGPLIAGFFLWAVLSLAWTVSPAMTLRGLSETLPELMFGCAVAAAWPLTARRSDLALLGIGVVLAGVLIAAEAYTGMPLHRLVGARAMPYDLKRSSIPPLLLVWPAIRLCRERRQRARAVVLVGFAALGSIVSHSSASVVAVAVGTAVYAVASWRPRRSVSVYAGLIAALLVIAPWTGTLMSHAVSPSVARWLEEQHAKERVAIWSAFEARVWHRPWIGHGFDASFRLGDPVPGQVETAEDRVIRDIHPHNQLLQVWIDFGAVGAVGVLAALGRLMRTLRVEDAGFVAPRLSFIAAATVMGMVGVQAWDAWWLATVAVVWASFAVLRQTETAPAATLA